MLEMLSEGGGVKLTLRWLTWKTGTGFVWGPGLTGVGVQSLPEFVRPKGRRTYSVSCDESSLSHLAEYFPLFEADAGTVGASDSIVCNSSFSTFCSGPGRGGAIELGPGDDTIILCSSDMAR